MRVTISELSPMLETLFKSGQSVRITVSGNSMYPLLRDRIDSVLLSPPKAPLKAGDIPLYKRDNGKYVMHRIIKIKENAYSISGDNQMMIEYPIYPEQVIAVVSAIYRRDKCIKISNIFLKLYSFIWVKGFKLRPALLKAMRGAAKFIRLFNKSFST